MDKLEASDSGLGKHDAEEDELFDEEASLGIAEDEQYLGMDDEVAADLDIGMAIEELPDGMPDAETELDWNWVGLIQPTSDDASLTDDETGPQGFDTAIGIAEIRGEDLDDSTLGVEDTDQLIVPDVGETVLEDREQVLFNELELELPDESVILDAAAPWQLRISEAGPYETLGAAGGKLLAGGDDLLLIEAEHSQRFLFDSALLSICASPGCSEVALATTKRGDVLLLSTADLANPTRLAWRTAVGHHVNPASVPSLASFPTHGGDTEFVALCQDGTLLGLALDTREFRKLRTPQGIVKLPQHTDRPLLLCESPAGAWFLESSTCQGPWRDCPIGTALSASLALGPFSFAAAGDCVAIAGPRLGLVVSKDRGQSFTRIPGCVGVTAMTLGMYLDNQCIWLALSHEVANRADLVLLDSGTLELTKVAQVETCSDGEFSPAQSLFWDPVHLRLLVAGEFGVKGFALPEKN